MPTWPYVVVIAASLGGLRALTEVLCALPLGFPAAVLVVQHLQPGLCHLTELLAKLTHRPVEWAQDGARVELGHYYVAPRTTISSSARTVRSCCRAPQL